MNKLDLKEYQPVRDDLFKQIETVRFATYDNFRVLRSTDNFIEKYLPFQIQELISKNLTGLMESEKKKQKLDDQPGGEGAQGEG